MLKNAYFLGKTVKNRLSVGESAPEPPIASGEWGLHPQTPALLHHEYKKIEKLYCNVYNTYSEFESIFYFSVFAGFYVEYFYLSPIRFFRVTLEK